MQLIPKNHQIPPLYSQEKVKDPVVVLKLFAPWTSWTWYITEYNPATGDAFGLVQGDFIELGNFSIHELEKIEGPFEMKIERDIHWVPQRLSEVRKTLK